MVATAPFRGFLYNPARVQDLRRVVAPPYDIINSEECERFHQKHEQNIIRLELGKELPGDSSIENRYTRSAQYLKDWRRDGVLLQDPEPAYYFYTMDYKNPAGVPKTVKGFFSLVHLEAYGQGGIAPHEETFPKPKADRLSLLRACRANLSPIFGLYSDPARTVLKQIEAASDPAAPSVDFVDETGIRHRLWKVRGSAALQQIGHQMQKKTVLIADGHHRYETALTFHQEDGTEASGWVMMYLSPVEENGFTILPTHRVLSGMPRFDPQRWLRRLETDFGLEAYDFTSQSRSGQCQRLLAEMAKGRNEDHLFGLMLSGLSSYYLLSIRSDHPVLVQSGVRRTPQGHTLDVDVLNKVLLHHYLGLLDPSPYLQFVKNEYDAVRLLESRSQIAFLLNPPTIQFIQELSFAGERLPQKTSYFYPKPLTGLVIRSFD
jgi:uncharacterized protein (DUF1015 family)